MSAEMISNHLKNREHKMKKNDSFKRKEKQESIIEEDLEAVELRKKQVRAFYFTFFLIQFISLIYY